MQQNRNKLYFFCFSVTVYNLLWSWVLLKKWNLVRNDLDLWFTARILHVSQLLRLHLTIFLTKGIKRHCVNCTLCFSKNYCCVDKTFTRMKITLNPLQMLTFATFVDKSLAWRSPHLFFQKPSWNMHLSAFQSTWHELENQRTWRYFWT